MVPEPTRTIFKVFHSHDEFTEALRATTDYLLRHGDFVYTENPAFTEYCSIYHLHGVTVLARTSLQDHAAYRLSLSTIADETAAERVETALADLSTVLRVR